MTKPSKWSKRKLISTHPLVSPSHLLLAPLALKDSNPEPQTLRLRTLLLRLVPLCGRTQSSEPMIHHLVGVVLDLEENPMRHQMDLRGSVHQKWEKDWLTSPASGAPWANLYLTEFIKANLEIAGSSPQHLQCLKNHTESRVSLQIRSTVPTEFSDLSFTFEVNGSPSMLTIDYQWGIGAPASGHGPPGFPNTVLGGCLCSRKPSPNWTKTTTESLVVMALKASNICQECLRSL